MCGDPLRRTARRPWNAGDAIADGGAVGSGVRAALITDGRFSAVPAACVSATFRRKPRPAARLPRYRGRPHLHQRQELPD